VTLVKKIVCFSKIHVTSLLGVLLIICITQGRMRLNWQVLLRRRRNLHDDCKFSQRRNILTARYLWLNVIKLAHVNFYQWNTSTELRVFFCWSHCRECSIQMNTDMPRCRSLLFFEMPVWNVLENVILGWRCFITVLSVV